MDEAAQFQAILSDAMSKLEALGLYGVVVASVSGLDRAGYCAGEVSERIGPAAKVMHLGFVHVLAHEEMEVLHPAAVKEKAMMLGEVEGNA